MSIAVRQSSSSNNNDQVVIGNACMVLVLCSAAVAGRFTSRWMAKLRIEADDYLTLVALVREACPFLYMPRLILSPI